MHRSIISLLLLLCLVGLLGGCDTVDTGGRSANLGEETIDPEEETGDPGVEEAPSDPFGNLIAVTARTGEDTTRIVLLDFDTFEIERFVPSPAQDGQQEVDDFYPLFSPDKSKIAFYSRLENQYTMVVYDLEADSLILFRDPDFNNRLIEVGSFVWSEAGDGLYISSSSRNIGGPGGATLLRLDNSYERVSSGALVHEVIGRDSILARGGWWTQQGHMGLIDEGGQPFSAVPYPDSVDAQVPDNWVISLFAWNASMRVLAYTFSVPDLGRHIGMSDLSGGNFHAFLNPAWSDRTVTRLSWGPDDRLIVSVESRHEEPRVFLLDPATSEVREYLGPAQVPGLFSVQYVVY